MCDDSVYVECGGRPVRGAGRDLARAPTVGLLVVSGRLSQNHLVHCTHIALRKIKRLQLYGGFEADVSVNLGLLFTQSILKGDKVKNNSMIFSNLIPKIPTLAKFNIY